MLYIDKCLEFYMIQNLSTQERLDRGMSAFLWADKNVLASPLRLVEYNGNDAPIVFYLTPPIEVQIIRRGNPSTPSFLRVDPQEDFLNQIKKDGLSDCGRYAELKDGRFVVISNDEVHFVGASSEEVEEYIDLFLS